MPCTTGSALCPHALDSTGLIFLHCSLAYTIPPAQYSLHSTIPCTTGSALCPHALEHTIFPVHCASCNTRPGPLYTLLLSSHFIYRKTHFSRKRYEVFSFTISNTYNNGPSKTDQQHIFLLAKISCWWRLFWFVWRWANKLLWYQKGFRYFRVNNPQGAW
jgi:hypothetical protein